MSGFRFQSQEPAKPASVGGPASSRAASKKPAAKIDPRFLKAARELRDRYLERVNSDGGASLLPQGKYDVARALLPGAEPLPHGRGSLPEIVEVKALPAAA